MLHLFTKCRKPLLPKSCHPNLQSLYYTTISITNFSSTSINSRFSSNLGRTIGINSNSNISSSFSTNISLIEQQKTYSVKDLLVACGFKSSTKQVSVVTFFKSFGFSDTQIKTIITKRPSLLLVDFSRIIQPKIEFFRSVEFSQQDVIKIVTSDPLLLTRSLQNHLIPAFDLLKKYYGGQKIAVRKIKHWPCLLRCQLDTLPLNVKTLRDFGVAETLVTKMITGKCCLVSASTKPDYFKKVVTAVMEMGFDPNFTSFDQAVHTMAWHTEPAWLKKLDVFKSLGFSDGEIHDMFKKQATSLCLSEKKIRAAAKFYFEKFKWSPSYLAKYPNALMYSLDKRVVPRCSVLQVLVSRNCIEKVKVLSLLVKTENEFMERYINKYKDKIPEVLDAYQGKITFDSFNFGLK